MCEERSEAGVGKNTIFVRPEEVAIHLQSSFKENSWLVVGV